MSIKNLPENKVIEQTKDIITNQQKNLKRLYILENIKKVLEKTEDDSIIFDEGLYEFSSWNWEYLPTDSDFIRSIKSNHPKLYSEIKKNKKDISSLLQNFINTHEINIETITEKNRKKLFSMLQSIAREDQIETTEASLTNLANAMIHSPNQSFFYARKKAIEMEELMKKKIEEPDTIFKNSPDNVPKQRGKTMERNLENFETIYVPEMLSFTKCEVFYYEEDYYDCVNRQTLLIDIRNKNIRFRNGMEVRKKEELIKKERIGNIALKYPDFDYYFLYKHKRFWLQCIGWLSINKWGFATMTIHNHNDSLRYGTKYINENNREYRWWSCTEDGDVHPELALKDTASSIDIKYKMFKKL